MAKIIPIVPPRPPGLEEALDALVFSKWDQDFLKTEAGTVGREVVVFTRFHDALRFTVPWLSEHIDLANARIVEIGCGSGSSTAALALHSKAVHGFDIDAAGVSAAEVRCKAFGVENAKVTLVSAESLLPSVIENAKDVDVFMLYAVLEHLTYKERLETLSTLWKALPEGGHLVIVETPNRLVYMDRHTSDTEFFHLLPDDLAFAYIDRTQRAAFKDSMREPIALGPEAASLSRIRWGLGASYHEIVLAIDEPLDEIIVADGFEREMTDFFREDLEEKLLVKFFLEHPVKEPMAFARCVLNLILRKPRNATDRAEARAFNARRRIELTPSAPSPPAPPPTLSAWLRHKLGR